MKKISIKKIVAMLLVVLLILSITSASFAVLDPGKVVSRPGQASEKVFNIAGVILGVAQAIGVSVAVIMLVVIAIKYITASAEGKAEVKKYAVGYILGAVLLFAGVAILRIIQEFAVVL